MNGWSVLAAAVAAGVVMAAMWSAGRQPGHAGRHIAQRRRRSFRYLHRPRHARPLGTGAAFVHPPNRWAVVRHA